MNMLFSLELLKLPVVKFLTLFSFILFHFPEAVEYVLKERVEKPLTQLKEGLSPILDLLEENKALMEPVFVAGKLPLTAERLYRLFNPEAATDEEENVSRHWRRFLTDCERK